MHPLVAKHAVAGQNEDIPGLTPRQACVATVLLRIDYADDRWPSETPLRAALIETMIRIFADERRGTDDYRFARNDLVTLLEQYGDDALRKLEVIRVRFPSAYADTVLARHKAKAAFDDLIQRRSCVSQFAQPAS